ncbi:MAG: protein phosphatase 2C domain-containing protein [Deltaproteobacteria bacterium]|nr:protein phosphatase 2C domain-containing protein [Deltaproteobacteria bacterium]
MTQQEGGLLAMPAEARHSLLKQARLFGLIELEKDYLTVISDAGKTFMHSVKLLTEEIAAVAPSLPAEEQPIVQDTLRVLGYTEWMFGRFFVVRLIQDKDLGVRDDIVQWALEAARYGGGEIARRVTHLFQFPGFDADFLRAIEPLMRKAIPDAWERSISLVQEEVDPLPSLTTSLMVNVSLPLKGADGGEIGRAYLVAGGESGSVSVLLPDGSRLSAKTTGAGKAKKQEDGYYVAHFKNSDGIWVKILAVADGNGGHKGGDVASSAFLNGLHQGVARAISTSSFPDPKLLFRDGVRMLRLENQKRGIKGNTTALLVVIVGDQAHFLSAGDSMGAISQRSADQTYYTVGYSHVDSAGRPNLNSAANNDPNAGSTILHAGDQVTLGSDGFWANVVNRDYTISGSGIRRLIYGAGAPSQKTFENLNILSQATKDSENSAEVFHDLAASNIETPGATLEINGHRLTLPEKPDVDNVVALVYEHGPSSNTLGVEGADIEVVDLSAAPKPEVLGLKNAGGGTPHPEEGTPDEPDPRNLAGPLSPESTRRMNELVDAMLENRGGQTGSVPAEGHRTPQDAPIERTGGHPDNLSALTPQELADRYGLAGPIDPEAMARVNELVDAALADQRPTGFTLIGGPRTTAGGGGGIGNEDAPGDEVWGDAERTSVEEMDPAETGSEAYSGPFPQAGGFASSAFGSSVFGVTQARAPTVLEFVAKK